jgi:hypothetical protein
VEVIDFDGNVLAVPGLGDVEQATTTTNPIEVYGDACRGGSPPANCP